MRKTAIVRSVVIEPEEAARNGAQWRVVTQWQGAGEAQSEALQLVEFKNVPGWEAPSPIVLKNKPPVSLGTEKRGPLDLC